jgi:hypothetical protein
MSKYLADYALPKHQGDGKSFPTLQDQKLGSAYSGCIRSLSIDGRENLIANILLDGIVQPESTNC